jgi:predicted protein tyrosine phosphatase
LKRTFSRIGNFPHLAWSRLREQGPRATMLWVTEHAVRVTTGAPRMRTSKIEPGIVVGGQYRRRGWPALQREGVTAVLSLREEFCDAEAGIAPASYLRLATPDDEAPTLEQMKEGVAFIERELEHGGGVYVHCGAGVGRAATMAAAYFVAQHATPDEAWARIRRVRPFVRPTARQKQALEAWATSLRV